MRELKCTVWELSGDPLKGSLTMMKGLNQELTIVLQTSKINGNALIERCGVGGDVLCVNVIAGEEITDDEVRLALDGN